MISISSTTSSSLSLATDANRSSERSGPVGLEFECIVVGDVDIVLSGCAGEELEEVEGGCEGDCW